MRSYEAALRKAIAPAPDPEARLRAKRAALEEFDRALTLPSHPAETQAELPEPASDTPELAPKGGRCGTASFRRSVLSNLLAGAAAACITALGVTSLLPGLHMRTPPMAYTVQIYDVPPAPAVALLDITVPSYETSVPKLEMPSAMVEMPASKLEMSALVVTGSRIPRSNLIAGNPVSIATEDELTGRDRFQHFATHAVKRVANAPVSTFSIDVDTASYSFVRRQLTAGALPQKDAIRAEEMINYFDYSWPGPKSRDVPFETTVAVGDSLWGEGKKLVHIGIKGYDLPAHEVPHANLVLLLDVSGSMASPDKLPLVQQSMALLISRLKPTDTVAIVTYAGMAGVVLEPTEVRERQRILSALQTLEPGGSTAGAAGIEQAYELAELHFRQDGINRILLATDGDFNVGISDVEELKAYVARQRQKGILFSVLGYGQGNYHDEMAQALAQNGNGVAAYIDTLSEAQRVLVQQATSSLFTIAKDVKIQVEFNPATVADYRLVGYETRALAREDFDNDAVDAGDIGSGHTVTAIYEITPAGSGAQPSDERRYAPAATPTDAPGKADEYGYLRIRYKLPDGRASRLIEQPIPVNAPELPASVARDVEFATAVAGFAQLLREDPYTGALTYEDVLRQAESAKGDDPDGRRAEFVELVRELQNLAGQ